MRNQALLGNIPAFLSQLINFYFNGEPAAQDRGGFLVRQARCEGRLGHL
jgi:hypothetical protein